MDVESHQMHSFVSGISNLNLKKPNALLKAPHPSLWCLMVTKSASTLITRPEMDVCHFLESRWNSRKQGAGTSKGQFQFISFWGINFNTLFGFPPKDIFGIREFQDWRPKIEKKTLWFLFPTLALKNCIFDQTDKCKINAWYKLRGRDGFSHNV